MKKSTAVRVDDKVYATLTALKFEWRLRSITAVVARLLKEKPHGR